MPKSPKKAKTTRQKRRQSDSPMPQAGAGLIRFYQDASNGIKVSPVTTLVCSILLMVFVILAHAGVMDFLIS